jgi:formiminotetrahydrofolate cyclodeaminase
MEWLDAIAAQDEPAAAGVACALTCATAAALVELTAGLAADRLEREGSGSADRMRALGARAAELRAKALALADEDVAAYGRVRESEPDARPAALALAAEPPLAIAECATELAAAAAEVERAGSWPFTPDAVVAGKLAASAASGASRLAAANLAT